jgi:hypothetical protein
VGLPKWRASAGYSTSWISVLLPEPLTPVTHHQPLQRQLDRHVLQVVLARAFAAPAWAWTSVHQPAMPPMPTCLRAPR